MVTLLMLKPSNNRSGTWEVKTLRPGLFTIGRTGAADIGVACDAEISRLHCDLVVTPNGLVKLRDLGSTNGTYVGGARVTERVLMPGAQVQVGGTLFKILAPVLEGS